MPDASFDYQLFNQEDNHLLKSFLDRIHPVKGDTLSGINNGDIKYTADKLI